MSSFVFRSKVVPSSGRVVAFRGDEAISNLFAFEIHLLLPEEDCAHIDLDQAIGGRATLSIHAGPHEGSVLSDYHGILSEVEIVHVQHGSALLRVVLAPKLTSLVESNHSRMYTGQAFPAVLEDVLQDSELAPSDYTLRLTEAHPVEEHICEYDESHYAFASRWMQREGIYFYFDHEGKVEQAILVDHRSAHEPCQTPHVRYRPTAGGDASAGSAFQEFFERTSALPTSVQMRDYDYTKPSLEISGQHDVSPLGAATVVNHGARFFSPGEGTRLAKLRAEELLAAEHLFVASGPVFGMRPGYTFELTEHPEQPLNQSYLVVEAHHEGAHAGALGAMEAMIGRTLHDGYRVRVTAIPAKVQYRSPARTPWPHVSGFEYGVVDGPATSPYAQVDGDGRYKVKIHFDASDLRDGKASTWVRMAQPHGGSPEAFHFPLRKGTEVLLSFLGGDPDRPFIAGAVPNAHTPSAVVAANHTQNVIQTGGKTRIEFEDIRGRQHIYIHTPPQNTYLHLGKPWRPTHYVEYHTGGDCLFEIGSDQDIHVGGKLTEKVTGAVDETYKTSQTSTIQGPQSTTVTNAVVETYNATQHTTVLGLRDEIFSAGQFTMVGGGLRNEEYEVGQTTTVTGGVIETYTGPLTRTVTGFTSETYKGTLDLHVTGAVTKTYPAGVTETFGPVTATWKSLNWTASAPITVNAPFWTVTCEETFHLWGSHTAKFDQSDSVHTLKFDSNMLKLDFIGLFIALAGLKMELNGVKIVQSGPNVEAGGFKGKWGVLQLLVTGLTIYI